MAHYKRGGGGRKILRESDTIFINIRTNSRLPDLRCGLRFVGQRPEDKPADSETAVHESFKNEDGEEVHNYISLSPCIFRQNLF